MIQLHKISYKFIVLFLHSNQKGLAPRNMLGFGTIYCFYNLILDTFSYAGSLYTFHIVVKEFCLVCTQQHFEHSVQ